MDHNICSDAPKRYCRTAFPGVQFVYRLWGCYCVCVCTGHDSIEIANVYILMVFAVFWKVIHYCIFNAAICRQLPNPQYGVLGGAVTTYIYIYIYVYHHHHYYYFFLSLLVL